MPVAILVEIITARSRPQEVPGVGESGARNVFSADRLVGCGLLGRSAGWAHTPGERRRSAKSELRNASAHPASEEATPYEFKLSPGPWCCQYYDVLNPGLSRARRA